jgi:ribonuclease J
MSNKIRVFALGGLDENGKCMFVIDIDENIFIIEAGLKYPDVTNPGIDAIIANYEYLKNNRHRVKAYIITHGHDDQMGALPYIYHHVMAPIYATKATIELIKQQTKVSQVEQKYEFVAVEPTSSINIAGHHFELYQTTHSVIDTFGFALKTPHGHIVYSGDFIIEYNASRNYKHDLNALAKIAEKETLLLLTESSGADKPGYTSPNHRLVPHLTLPYQDATGRIFLALYNQSVYNLEEAVKYSLQQQKRIVFYDQETEEYINTFQKLGALNIPKDRIVERENHLRVPPQDLVIIMMGPGEKIYKKIAEFAVGQHDDKTFMLTSNDTFIVGCPSAPAIEVLATNAIDDLYRTGAEIINIQRKQISSMHAQEEDIKTLLSLLKPKYYMPVKGEYVQLVANAKLGISMKIGLTHRNTFLMDNGMVLQIIDGIATVLTNEKDRIDTSDILIDGLGVGDVRTNVIAERKQLSDDGLIVMGITISKKQKKIIAGPDVQMRGFVFVKDSEVILKEIIAIYLKHMDEYLHNKSMMIEQLKQQVIDKCIRYIRRQTGKQPLIIPIIIDSDET